MPASNELAVFEQMTESVAVYDRDGRVRYVNPTTERLFGITRAELVGKVLWEVFPDSVGNPFHRAFERVAASGKRESLDHYYAPFSAWFANDIFVVADAVCVIARDITLRKKAEADREALLARTLESESLFRILGEAVPDLLWMSDADGRPLYQNPAWRAYTGMTSEDLARAGWESLHWPGELDEHRRLWAIAKETGAISRFEGRLRRHDGEYRWFAGKTVPFKDDTGQIVRWVGILTDIDDRRRAEERLRESEERLARERERLAIALRTGGLGVYEWTIGAPDVWWSPEIYEVYGVDPSTFRPTTENFGTLVHPDDRDELWRKTEERIRSADVFTHEYRIVCPDGSVRWVLNQSRVGVDANGAPVRLTGVAVDVTSRKAAEQALKKSEEALLEADRRKDEFLATLAHELRNPLAPIRSGVEILKTGSAPEPEHVLDVMARQISHMVRLVDDLLDVSRVSSGKITLKKERVALRTVVESALEASRPVVEAARHDLTVSLPADPVWLDADPTRVAQVVSNLLNNAAKYTGEGGRIDLSADVRDGRVVLSVADTGVGIAPEMIPRVFELFTQVGRTLDRAQGGLGIGLSLARKLVELHDGTLTAHSDGLGRGSTFIVDLPRLVDTSPEAPLPRRASPSKSTKPLRILIVDDNQDGAETLSILLELDGHETRVTIDGPSAVEAAHAFRPDVVFLDIGLPGISGFEVARKLRREADFERLCIVAVTGWGSDDDRKRSHEAGFDHHLTKPIDHRVVHDLLTRIATARLA